MKNLIKGIVNMVSVGIGASLTRNCSAVVNNKVALLQMQNIDYVPNFNQNTLFINLVIWSIVLLITYTLWKKEIKYFLCKSKAKK